MVKGPLRQAGAHLQRATGQELGPRQLMATAVRVAAHIPAFYQQDLPATGPPAPPPSPERALRRITRQANALGLTVRFDPIEAA